MEYQSFLMETFFSFFKQISLLYHYFFMIMETKSNENLMENKIKCPNSIKNKMIFSLAFHQIDFDWVQIFFTKYVQ